jgi:hypothetical protein
MGLPKYYHQLLVLKQTLFHSTKTKAYEKIYPSNGNIFIKIIRKIHVKFLIIIIIAAFT